jgi:hypothetical protein
MRDPGASGFFHTFDVSDPGGDHVHLIRNEGNVVAATVAVQLIPAGQPCRIEAAAPGNCRLLLTRRD